MTHMLYCYVIPNWHGGSLLSPCYSGIGFCQLIFYQKCPNFLEVKIDINWINLTPCQAHSLIKMPLGGAKDKYFLAFIAHANEGCVRDVGCPFIAHVCLEMHGFVQLGTIHRLPPVVIR